MSISMKKRKLHEDEEDSSPTKIVSTSSSSNKKEIIYILPDCIGPRRLEIMKNSANKMGFTLSARMT